jgi:hypothetical protein
MSNTPKPIRQDNYFICQVQDSINKFDVISENICYLKTPKQAEAYFMKLHDIKRHIGKERYKIVFRQNAIVIQQNKH